MKRKDEGDMKKMIKDGMVDDGMKYEDEKE